MLRQAWAMRRNLLVMACLLRLLPHTCFVVGPAHIKHIQYFVHQCTNSAFSTHAWAHLFNCWLKPYLVLLHDSWHWQSKGIVCMTCSMPAACRGLWGMAVPSSCCEVSHTSPDKM